MSNRPRRSSALDDFWIVTAYFNPVGYRSRLRNYEVFHEHIRASGLRLITIECVFGDASFELPTSPDIMQVRTRDVMWQKERLLNLAIARLPAACTKVAWVDCDLLFENPGWAAATSRLLDQHAMVQPFEVPIRLLQDGTKSSMPPWTHSFAAVYARNRSAGDSGNRRMIHPGNQGRHDDTGLAWAARRDVLATHGIYDASIAGGADHLIAHAICNDWASPCIDRMLGMNTPHRRHAQRWGERFYAGVRGDISYVEGGVWHLWHGDYSKRDYTERHRALQAWGFDPHADIRIGADGCWEWATPKHDLHRWVAEYFERRDEDGDRTMIATELPRVARR
jgi:hypothetical protein